MNALEIARNGSVEVKGMVFEALPTLESLMHKESPDENAIYRFELEGVSILHLGDLGNLLAEEQLGLLRGNVDILLALTGGPPTIELEDLDRAIEEIKPSVPDALPDTEAQAGHPAPRSVHLQIHERVDQEGGGCGSRVQPGYASSNL